MMRDEVLARLTFKEGNAYTRGGISVKRIATLNNRGLDNKAIADKYPQILRESDVEAALVYYQHHKKEVDDEIAKQKAAIHHRLRQTLAS